MHNLLSQRHWVLHVTICLLLSVLVSGCDRRKYSTTVYSASEGSGAGLQSDPANPSGSAVNGSNGSSGSNGTSGTSGTSGSNGTSGVTGTNITGGTSGSDENNGADGTDSTNANSVNSANNASNANSANNTSNSAVSSADDELLNDNPGSTTTGPSVGTSSALENTSTGAQAESVTEAEAGTNAENGSNAEAGTNAEQSSAANNVGGPGSIGSGAAGSSEITPVAPLPAAVPLLVPDGPEIDRVSSSSIYQPLADEETATFTIDGRPSFALAAVGGPVLQSPRALMEEIDEYHLNNADQVAFSGRFSIASQNAYGIWVGARDTIVQLFQTGTAIPGLAETQTYFKTLKLALGEDGSVAQLMQVQDAGTLSQAYVVSSQATHRVLMTTDTTLPGLIGPVRVDSIEVVDSQAGVDALVSIERIVTTTPVEGSPSAAVVSDSDSATDEEEEPLVTTTTAEQFTLWYGSNGNSKAVAHSWNDENQSAPVLANGCKLYAPDNTVDNSRLSVTRSGQLLFQGQIGGDGACDEGRAVMRYTGSAYQEVVKNGDGVPGSANRVFTDVSLYSVTDDGSAIVFANLVTTDAYNAVGDSENEPAADTATDTDAVIDIPGQDPVEADDTGYWSLWVMPPVGGARLIAMKGEEIQVGRIVNVFSGEPRDISLRVNSSNQFVLKLLLADSEDPVFFTGPGHNGQPHQNLDLPGASALSYAFTNNSVLPGQTSGAVLSDLGSPYISEAGNVVVYGEVGPSEEALAAAEAAAGTGTLATAGANAGATAAENAPLIEPFNSIWQVDASGVLRELIRSGDLVAVAGVNKPIASLSVAGQIARPGTSGVRINSRGTMLMRANIKSRFGNSILLFVTP